MSSSEVVQHQTVPKTEQNNKHTHHHNKGKTTSNNMSKRKNKYDRGARKRSKSFSGCGIQIEPKPVLPSKFLLGGNINDPLNLNSLQDEEINRAMNAVTPKSSPIPTPPRRKGPIEVMIPPNTHDPLHLIDCEDDAEYEQQLCSPMKKVRKKRLKKRRTYSSSAEVNETSDISSNNCSSLDVSEAKTPDITLESAKIPEVPDSSNPEAIIKSKVCRDLSIEIGIQKKDRNKRKSEEYSTSAKKFKHSMDKIVSPVVPQPGAWLKRSNSVNKWTKQPRQNQVKDEQLPVFKSNNKRYQYGNYNRYYGYRNPNHDADHRLKLFSHNPHLFHNKDILDIGCNIGHITLSIARDFRAKSVLGIDIDPNLITVARRNVKYYVKTAENSPKRDESLFDKTKINTKVNKNLSNQGIQDNLLLKVVPQHGRNKLQHSMELNTSNLLLKIATDVKASTNKTQKDDKIVRFTDDNKVKIKPELIDEVTTTKMDISSKEDLVSSSECGSSRVSELKSFTKEDHARKLSEPIRVSINFGTKPNETLVAKCDNSDVRKKTVRDIKMSDFKDPTNRNNGESIISRLSSTTDVVIEGDVIVRTGGHHVRGRSISSANNANSSEFFPISMPIIYGAIDIPGFTESYQKGRGFPHNVRFKQCNYVLEDESLLALEQPKFDVILCLSVTKWFHLNWGDTGLKLAFRRMYEQLRPGGKLILEPQNWAGYKSKKKLTETIYRNYNSIEFFPDKFSEYLLSPAVGFAKSEMLGCPAHRSAGFRRPVQVFTKSTMFPSERVPMTPCSGGGQSKSTEEKELRVKEEQGVEHVYTDLWQSTRYCDQSDETNDINTSVGKKQDDIELHKSSKDKKPQSDDGNPAKKTKVEHLNLCGDNT